MRVVPGAIARRQQDVEVPADRLIRRVAKNVFSTAVEVYDPLRLIDGDDRVRGNCEDAGELRFGGTERVLDALARSKPRLYEELPDKDQRQDRADDQQRNRQIKSPREVLT
jgi:hypothetical protein